MSEHIKSPVELQIDQLAACNVGGRIRAAISAVEAKELGAAVGGLEELLCFIEQRDLPEEQECGVPVGMRQWDPKVAAMLKLMRKEIGKQNE